MFRKVCEIMDKWILVTGASSGIGEVVSKFLSSQGYGIVMVARNSEKLRELSQILPSKNIYVSYDLSDLEHIEDIFTICKEKMIKLDGLVHCAGINNDIPIRSNDIKVMQDVTTINYFSFVEMGKYFCKKKYSNDGASVVAISSSAADACMKGMCTYSASKAALNASVKVMGKEFLKRHQRVNAVMPSFVDTPMAKQVDEALGDLDSKIASQPLGLIEPIQIAYLVEFLISDKSAYMTGACIPISGGAIL